MKIGLVEVEKSLVFCVLFNFLSPFPPFSKMADYRKTLKGVHSIPGILVLSTPIACRIHHKTSDILNFLVQHGFLQTITYSKLNRCEVIVTKVLLLFFIHKHSHFMIIIIIIVLRPFSTQKRGLDVTNK